MILKRNVNQMTWTYFVEEFNAKFFNRRAISAQQKEFNELKQGNLTVTEAITKFNQLARMCPRLVPTEEERFRRMMEMFRPELAMAVDSGSEAPTTVANCVTQALRAEYRITQIKEERAQFHKARIEERNRDRKGNKKPQGGGNNKYRGQRIKETTSPRPGIIIGRGAN